MDYIATQQNFPKIEYPHGFELLYHEQYLQYENQLLDIPPLPLQSLIEPNLPPLTHHYDQLTDFHDFDDFGVGFFFDNTSSSTTNFDDVTMVDKKPQPNYATPFDHNNNFGNFGNGDLCSEVSRVIEIRDIYANLDNNFEEGIVTRPYTTKRKKCVELGLDDIQKYFDVPIKEAAKELGVGVTRLKKRCRELGITRWPHRKFKSLRYLISNVKKMGLDGDEILMLEEHKRLLEEAPNLGLNEKAKRLRQACFKANYKNKRSLAISSANQV